ncbi:acetolactate synthase large subunit [Aestuariirhabdus sp. Z084]|uniref:acetolactate synthase large subunit n=1 Tax=Aestuariirhabdus haliotis TaxID=2918751 RepID=UPI00201B352F|nr:acetolactate synthase large subunit [Aestuariirhabdus haliotis]MCL6415823.1 acetolactate synthase large subunit [Aestuariirhabdus haliotis]MCL6419875.1 acetolactate synthase large subunit [Aestuariirhabdus haliotis]
MNQQNGAEAMLASLINAGVEICFANPGTSEMQMVAAMDKISGMRPVLVLFEGVASGAADGYGRIADKPAATMLHLGPGLSNAMANLHNARRAHTPMLNLIGDHASSHAQYDAPLASDIVGQANTVCDWVRVAESAEDLARCGVEAVQQSQQGAGQVTSVVVPADFAWTPVNQQCAPLAPPVRETVSDKKIEAIAEQLQDGGNNALMLGGVALRKRGLTAAGRIARKLGIQVFSETFPTRWQRGAGLFQPTPVPYLAELAITTLKGLDKLVLVGAKAPVAFFAYPNLPGQLTDESTELLSLASVDEDLDAALEALAERLGAHQAPEVAQRATPPAPREELCMIGVGAVIAELMPENCIVSEEAVTGSFGFYPMTQGAAPHEVLTVTGGAIGQGLPVAAGAALAAPERKVLCLHGDGGAMYTPQSLWTIARENLDVTIVIYKNNSYSILNLELMRTGASGQAEQARSLLDLSNPIIDWVGLATSMGIPASSANTVADFRHQFADAMAQQGPRLIEAELVEMDLLAAVAAMAKEKS